MGNTSRSTGLLLMAAKVKGTLVLFLIGILFPFVAFALDLQQSTSSAEVTEATVTLPNPSGRDRPNIYIQTLVEQALLAQGIKVTFDYYQLPSNQIRLNKLLEESKTIDLAWLPADAPRLEKLDYVPVPLYQGLHGKRLLLIKSGQQSRFDKVQSLSDLASMVALQQRSWSDYKILTDNKLKVNGELSYSAMLRALGQGIGDYFPRSVLTVYAEEYSARDLQLAIEKRLMLDYPTYTLLFTSKKQPQLMDALRDGFESIMSSGQYEKTFREFYQDKLEALNLSGRRVFFLKNNDLPTNVVEQLKANIVYQ